MPTDETQPLLDFTLDPGEPGRTYIYADPNEPGRFRDMEPVAQGLCGLAFWAGQLQGENEKLRQEAANAPRSDAGALNVTQKALLPEKLQEAARALLEAQQERSDLAAELRVARERAASFHAQVGELVERNTALEQEVEDLRMGALTHSAEAQDDVLREVERWRLASESLEQQLLQARAELLRYRALVDGFARELGEAMLKRALEVRT